MKRTLEFLRKHLAHLMAWAMVVAAAQAMSVSSATTNDAAGAWQILTRLVTPSPPAEWETNPPTAAELAKFQREVADKLDADAEKAREFYTRFPENAQASEARLLELKIWQLAVRFGMTNRLADLAACERNVLKIPNLSKAERYALRLDIINHELEVAGTNREALLEKFGRELVRDYPENPQGYMALFDVADASDPPKARELLNLILATNTPDEIQVPAQSLLKQLDLIGTSPDVQFTATDGRPVDLRALTGKVVLVDFWATWCPPCVALFPEIKAVYDKWHPQGLEVIGINLDDKKPLFARFVADRKASWPQYYDGQGWQNKFVRQFGVGAIPAVWLVDKKGIVRGVGGGAGLESRVRKLLAE